MSTRKNKANEDLRPSMPKPAANTAAIDSQNEVETGKIREESLRWLFSIVGTLLAYTIVAKIVVAIYHPDIAAMTAAARKMFVEGDLVRPEPVEGLLFQLAMLLVMPLILCFYALFPKLKIAEKLGGNITYKAISAVCFAALIALIYSVFAAPNPWGRLSKGERPQNKRDIVGSSNFDFYFEGLFTGQYIWIYTLLVVPLMALIFFYGFRKKGWDNSKVFRLLTSFVGYSVLALTIIAIVVMHTISFPYTDENKFDFNAVYYSMTQVYAGLPMLVDGFTNTYGLYPHFLNPIFQVIGLSVLKFSTVMALLTGVAFVLNFYFLKYLVRNRIILFLGFATVLFFPYLNFKLLTVFDCLFSLHPIRYLVASGVVCLASLYFIRRTKILYWTTFVVSAGCVLWNPEIGLVTYLSWVCSVIYNDYYDKQGKANIKGMALHAVTGAAVLFSVFCIYKLLIYVFYGSWPNMALVFDTMKYFGKYGVGLLPMKLLHPWNLTVLILIPGFVYSVSKWYNKDITTRSTLFLMVSLISVGYFTYFQGRSQNSNLALSSGFNMILLTMLVDELWDKARRHNLLLLNGIFVIGLFFITSSFFEIMLDAKKIAALVYQDEDRSVRATEQNELEVEMEFILANSSEGEKINIYSVKKYQCLLFDGHKRRSGFNPGYLDMFLWSDMRKMEQSLIDSSFKIFIIRNRKVYPYMIRPHAIIAAKYEVTKNSRRFSMLSKRTTKIPEETFFNDRANTLVHRKYGDDTAGLNRRINDAITGMPATPDSVFSVEALFYAMPQAFEHPTIIGNISDTNGFAIGKLPTQDNKFYFGINTIGVHVALPYQRWMYVVMNISPGFIEVFVNGNLVTKQAVEERMRPSKSPVVVGGFGDYNYYLGAISEVAVSNGAADPGTVARTWAEIEQSLKRMK